MICANAMVILVIGFLSCTVHVAAKWKEYDGWHWHTFGDFTWLMDLKYTIRENEGFARTRDEPAERVKRLAERPKRTWISENPGKDECLRLRPGITELQYGYNQFYFRENPFDLFPDTSPLFRFTCKYIDSIDEDFQKPKQILRIKLSQEFSNVKFKCMC
ncbi:uncharacterized protein LOC118436685 [Folsomia candida]|uniref:uncharacterized protein LOC118436685 n=1 Tax=Folsomia candida TaxID=158441 RepID=UPI001605498D|nr:uncharacterized protein LOC118436685 [Folsomia candida]